MRQRRVIQISERYDWRNITRNIFDKTLDSLIECGSVKCNLISSITCLSLRKHNVIENSNLEGNFNNF